MCTIHRQTKYYRLDFLFFNSILADKIVLVSKRKKNDFIFKINNIFFSRKINVIENGINIKKFKK